MVELGQDQLISHLEFQGCREIVKELRGRYSDANLSSVSTGSSVIQKSNEFAHFFRLSVYEARSNLVCLGICISRHLRGLVRSPELDIGVQQIRADTMKISVKRLTLIQFEGLTSPQQSRVLDFLLSIVSDISPQSVNPSSIDPNIPALSIKICSCCKAGNWARAAATSKVEAILIEFRELSIVRFDKAELENALCLGQGEG